MFLFGKGKKEKKHGGSRSVSGGQKGPQVYFRNLRLSEGQGKTPPRRQTISMGSTSTTYAAAQESTSAARTSSVQFAEIKKSVLALAQEVRQDARDAIKKYKSRNKSYPETDKQRAANLATLAKSDPAEAARAEKARTQFILDRQNAFFPLDLRPAPGTRMEDIIRLGDEVEAAEVGNCGHLAALVCKYLSEREPDLIFDLVVLSSPDSHAFVVIGQETDETGGYPKDFSEWDEDAIIVDAWANIVCSARDYPEKWKEKMLEWAAAGKHIATADPAAGLAGQKWISPEPGSVWYDGIEKFDKVSLPRMDPLPVIKHNDRNPRKE